MKTQTNQQIKVAWLSRHAMTPAQTDALESIIDHDYAIECVNHVWQATAEEQADTIANAAAWTTFLATYDVICGVFPPVAYASMPTAPKGRIFTPISEARPYLRKSPDAPIPFAHLRWQELGK